MQDRGTAVLGAAALFAKLVAAHIEKFELDLKGKLARFERDAGGTQAARPPASPRVEMVDLARGAGIVGMVIYHIGWDLYFFGISSVDVTSNLAWVIFARVVAGTFLVLVGVGLVLAYDRGLKWKDYLWRLTVIGGAAALVSGATYALFPEQFVYFGILHAIVAVSVLSLPFIVAPIAVVFAVAALLPFLPTLLASDAYDARFVAWIGLAADPPASVDFVPILSWFSLTLFGVGGARWALRSQIYARLSQQHFSGRFAKALQWTGRKSLAIYLLHQPILLGVLYAAIR